MKLSISYTKTQLYTFILGVGLFAMPSILRTTLISSPIIEINMIAGLAMLLLINHKQFSMYKNKENYKKLFIIAEIFLWFSFALVTLYRKDYRTCLLVAVTILLPTLLINVKIEDRALVACTGVWVNCLKMCASIMGVCGAIDLVSRFSISNFFANTYAVESLFSLLSSKRLVSYMGHALLSGEVFLITYISYYLYTTKVKRCNENIVWFILCFIGCALTQSKTCVSLIIVAFILFHMKWREQKYLLLGTLLLLLVYMSGALDGFINRFIWSIETNNLTTNRNSALISLLEAGKLHFELFKGQNIDYGWKMVAALEYPVLRWAYQFGIAVSLCLTFICFVLPVLSLLKQKAAKEFWVGVIIIAIDVNCYNGLALTRDNMLLYCLSIVFITNMARYCRESRK